MKTRINPAIEPIGREFKKALQNLYGDRLGNVAVDVLDEANWLRQDGRTWPFANRTYCAIFH